MIQIVADGGVDQRTLSSNLERGDQRIEVDDAALQLLLSGEGEQLLG